MRTDRLLQAAGDASTTDQTQSSLVFNVSGLPSQLARLFVEWLLRNPKKKSCLDTEGSLKTLACRFAASYTPISSIDMTKCLITVIMHFIAGIEDVETQGRFCHM